MKTTVRVLGFMALLLLLALPAMAADYDLVINNGRVIGPETTLDAKLNVGLKEGRIAVITEEKITGKETIDAAGHLVPPGFVDSHYHAMDPMGSHIALRQGITTGLELEMGVTNTMQWYEDMGRTGWVNNYGATSGLMSYR